MSTPMLRATPFPRFASMALVAVAGVIASGHATAQGTVNATASASKPAGPRYIHYNLTLTGRDSSGAYNWAGNVTGAVSGHAAVQLRFPNVAPSIPGTLPLVTHWVVTASPESQSFEASLTGSIDLASAKTHFAGTVTTGPWTGQIVETNSQVFNRAANGTLSNSVGTITILPPKS
jgi:hypothetical protein